MSILLGTKQGRCVFQNTFARETEAAEKYRQSENESVWERERGRRAVCNSRVEMRLSRVTRASALFLFFFFCFFFFFFVFLKVCFGRRTTRQRFNKRVSSFFVSSPIAFDFSRLLRFETPFLPSPTHVVYFSFLCSSLLSVVAVYTLNSLCFVLDCQKKE